LWRLSIAFWQSAVGKSSQFGLLHSMSEHLTPLDATLLELEEADESAHMHIGVIMVFDARRVGGLPSREEVCEHHQPARAAAALQPAPVGAAHRRAVVARMGERSCV
jgi:hypothetical protein